MKITSLNNIDHIFFIGVAGTGMSALAQYLAGNGKHITGSDRYFNTGENAGTQQKLESEGIVCFIQDGSGISEATQLVVISTAVEENNLEYQKALKAGIPIITRSELLTIISNSRRTIAIGGTSGKSTTTAMLYEIMEVAGMSPGIISGAGLTRLQKLGKIGNAAVGTGEWLVIEADESDGSIVNYHPEVGVLLNIDKDHKEISELLPLFQTFKENTSRLFVVNQSHPLTAPFSQQADNDFSSDDKPAGYIAAGFIQDGLRAHFTINHIVFNLNTIGRHNMENALAATAVAAQLGIPLEVCRKALFNYEGIYRRNQVLGQKNGVWVIDDFAHNPVKVATAIRSMQPLAKKVVAWFQPHGYGPTRFLRNDFVEEISAALRPQDEIWMSEIFYAGGTAVKNISAGDLISDLQAKGVQAFFVENRRQFLETARPHLNEASILILMGARDPSLDTFAREVFEAL